MADFCILSTSRSCKNSRFTKIEIFILLLSWQRLFHSKDVRVAKIAVQVSMPGVNLIKKRFFYSQADQKQLNTLAYSKSASKHNFGYISLDAVHKNKQTILMLVKSELINMTRAWDKEKSLTGIETMNSRTLDGRSTH